MALAHQDYARHRDRLVSQAERLMAEGKDPGQIAQMIGLQAPAFPS